MSLRMIAAAGLTLSLLVTTPATPTSRPDDVARNAAMAPAASAASENGLSRRSPSGTSSMPPNTSRPV